MDHTVFITKDNVDNNNNNNNNYKGAGFSKRPLIHECNDSYGSVGTILISISWNTSCQFKCYRKVLLTKYDRYVIVKNKCYISWIPFIYIAQ